MFALAINGSPRREGNTHALLEAVLAPLQRAEWKTEFFQLGGKNIRGCTACGKCFEAKNHSCMIPNDPFNGLYAKILEAEAVIIGTPTYFSGVSPEVKALLDRTGFVSIANGDMLRGKIGAAVVAVRRGGGIHAFDTINHMFLMTQMIVPGSLYWNLGFGLDRGEVKDDEEGLANMKNLGETIALLGLALVPLRNQWPKR
ncbi:MAG: flavodoxin family protein [Planctomycetota bacterium]|nr:flavodoxin family protein [Planctomycetota bacterium]